MRCLIALALFVVLANARQDYLTKNRFQRLLNQYQNQDDNLLGSDDVDDFSEDYVDEIRRERRGGRCPRRDLDEIDVDELNVQDETETEYETQNIDELEEQWPRRRRQNKYNTRRHHQYETEDNMDQESENEDEMISSRKTGLRSDLIKEVEDANVKLASRLYKQSKDEKDDKNTVVSPLSIQLALAALNAGARGNTKKQIGRVIGGRLQKRERKQVFKTLVRHLKGLGQNEYSTRQQTTKIHPVTGIFVTKTTHAQQMFVQHVKRNLGANVKQCNFQNQPQQCRQMINRFVAQKTQHKITHIVPQDAITDNTKMILVNALQLKAPWGRQMKQHQTKEAKFYPLDTKKVKIVEVMETQGQFKYHEDELVKIVGIPTEQKELTMYVIVPKDKDGLTDVEKLHLQDGVQLKQLLDLIDQKSVRRVDVQLPKFQIKHKIDVRRTLRQQGVTDAFDPQRADFSGITGVNKYEEEEIDEQTTTRSRRNPFLESQVDDEWTGQQKDTKLHLNKFIHQTTIKVTDNGITATTGSESPIDENEQDEEEVGYGRRHHRQNRDWESDEMNTFEEITGLNRRESMTTGQRKMVKANRAFAFVVKHNPTKQIIMVGRVIDAAQKKINGVHQTINNVDQL